MPTDSDDMSDDQSTHADTGSGAAETEIDGTDGTDGTDAPTPDDAETDGAEGAAETETAETGKPGFSWTRALAFGLLPGLALILAVAAALLKWQDSAARQTETARLESMQAAKDSTIAMLSYGPDTVEQDLNAARDRLTGAFLESFTALIRDVVIPGAQDKQIGAVATVPATASVSASPDHAVVLVFVNQTVTIGDEPPTASASSVSVQLDKIGGRWLVSDFTPV